MIRSTCALVLVVAGTLALTACGKKDDNASAGAAATDGPAASAAPTPVASDTASAAPPADSAAAPPSASAPPDVPPPPPPGPGPATGPIRGIDDCCAALASAAVMSRSARKRGNSDKAAEICPGIANLVRTGRANRATALTQIRSAFGGGGQVPGPCR